MSKSLKLTEIRMEWTDTGAIASFRSTSDLVIHCPRCNARLIEGIEHTCGDLAPPIRKTKTQRKRK